MKSTYLNGSTKIYCISKKEAQMLHEHIKGYFPEEITLNDNDIVFDVGANIGVYGVELSSRYQNIGVYAFEPIKDIFNILEANTELSNNANFNAFNFGISDQDESVEFTYYPNSPALSNSNPDIWKSKKDLIPALKGNLDNAPSSWWWAKYVPSFLYPFIINNLTKNAKKINCELKRLSSFISSDNIKKIDLLKIDCEGNELKVINGIDDHHWDIIRQLIIEVHDIDGRLDYINNLLKNKMFKTRIYREASLENTNLHNLVAFK